MKRLGRSVTDLARGVGSQDRGRPDPDPARGRRRSAGAGGRSRRRRRRRRRICVGRRGRASRAAAKQVEAGTVSVAVSFGARRARDPVGDGRGRAARQLPVRARQQQGGGPGRGRRDHRVVGNGLGRAPRRQPCVEAGPDRHPGGLGGPRLGEPAAEPALSRLLRRGGPRRSSRPARSRCEVLDEKALAKGGYGGILAVGSGSARPPRLVRLSYAPRGAKAHLALVGKGITFDSGGLDIKPADGMYTMKCDMAGAAAVLRRDLGDRHAEAEGQGHRVRVAGREPALRHRVPAVGRAHHVRRQDGRERQHRRRGSAGDGGRARPGQ